MAKARAKPRGANKYKPAEKSNAPGWIWLIAGIVIGGFIMFLMKLEPKQDIRPEQKTTTVARPKNHIKPDRPKFEYEFSQILSGNETTPTTSLTEQQRNKLDGERAAALLTGNTPPAMPPIQQPVQKPIVQPTNQPPVQKPAQVAVVTPAPKMNFFLQVGSYPSQTSAESIRAQILMLGQNAKLETVSSSGKTWYRVLVGAFDNKESATKAQAQLASQGFKQTLIIPRKIN